MSKGFALPFPSRKLIVTFHRYYYVRVDLHHKCLHSSVNEIVQNYYKRLQPNIYFSLCIQQVSLNISKFFNNILLIFVDNYKSFLSKEPTIIFQSFIGGTVKELCCWFLPTRCTNFLVTLYQIHNVVEGFWPHPSFTKFVVGGDVTASCSF